jgi:phage gp45-like
MRHLINKISNIIKRAVITLVNDDSKNIAHCQVSYNDKPATIETIYPYGMSANAPVGNIVLLFNVGSNEANLAGIPYSQQDRFKSLKSGESIFGNPISGCYIKFLENGDIELLSKKNVKIFSNNAELIVCDDEVTFLHNSTGSGEPKLGSNCPATELDHPYTYITAKAADGTVCYIPAWK